MRRKCCREPGMTIAEALVSLSVLALLSLILMMFLGQTRDASLAGQTRLELRGQHRQVQGRVTQILRSATPPNEVTPAIVWPEVGKTEMIARFHAPVSLLDGTLPFDPRFPDYPEFTLRRTTRGQMEVMRSDGTGTRQVFGRGLTSVKFRRLHSRTLEIELGSTQTIRGAAGSVKVVDEFSRNLVRVPSVR